MENEVRDALIGRDSEQTRIREVLLRLAAGEGGAVVVEGADGVGKSALVRAVSDDARAGRLTGLDEVTVSAVVAADSERGWPFSGLHLVLSAVVGSLEPEQQRQAARLVDDLTTRLEQTASAYELAVQVQPLVSRVRRPLVIVIDDAHRLDPQSLEVLGFVARRVGTSPLVFLVVVDTAERVPPLLGLPLIRLGELPATDATELVRRAAGSHTLHSVAARIAGRVGGNPRRCSTSSAGCPTCSCSARSSWTGTCRIRRCCRRSSCPSSARSTTTGGSRCWSPPAARTSGWPRC